MSERVRLTANDGHELEAYVARPEGDPIAGLVVAQEIFGINAHIRSVADGYAKDGFLVVAPALFDRYERGVELAYEGEDMQKAMSFAKRIDIDATVRDTAAALEYVRNETGKKCGVIGYCLGGTIAWLAATRLKADAAVGYYGGRIAMFAGEQPQAPVMLHFGRKDQHIPKEEVDTIAAAHPEVEIYWYDGGHGFNRDSSSEPARTARQRSVEFLKKHLS
jgi:carboxymethylenebutenolidase